MKDTDREMELNSLFQQLVIEFNVVQASCGKALVLIGDERFFWPAVWIEAMQSQEWLDENFLDADTTKILKKCRPLDVQNLAPMSERLKELARTLKLPEYEGLAEPVVQQQKLSRGIVRCSYCGTKCQVFGGMVTTCNGCGNVVR